MPGNYLEYSYQNMLGNGGIYSTTHNYFIIRDLVYPNLTLDFGNKKLQV